MEETGQEKNCEEKEDRTEEMEHGGSNEKAEKDISKDDTVTQAEPVVFKTPSFVIPSKNKVQSKKDSVFSFKKPASRSSPKENSIKEGHGGNEDTNSLETDRSSDQEKVGGDGCTKSGEAAQKTSKAQNTELLRQAKAAVPYKEPEWSTICEDKYSLEVLKNGSIIDKIDLDSKAFHAIGRLPSCDIPMEHPSLSRYHAILQYSSGTTDVYPQGWFLYDLDSTHGTWINKNRVPPLQYHRIHVDFCLKFGGSSRLFILQGPDKDRVEESELSVNEMVAQREKQKKEADFLRQAEIEEAQRKVELLKQQEEARGCSWGINEEEVVEEEESELNPFAVTDNEELYIDDPKKSLNGYFEREGLDQPQYEFTEASYGKWKCSVELPLDTPSGEPMIAEVLQSGKKREAVIACALEACRILDRHGVLRQSKHESKKRKQRNWEDDDFYDSDEDVYLDRTGTIERKREFRKNISGKTDNKTDTYDSLLEKHKAILTEMEDIESKLEHAKEQAAAMESEEVDALDAFMTAIKSGMMDTRTKMSLKRRMMELRQEEQKVRKLVNVAKPASLPELKPTAKKQNTTVSSLAGSVGKMKGAITGKVSRKPLISIKTVTKLNDPSKDVEFKEEEEEEEEEEMESLEVKSEIKINESNNESLQVTKGNIITESNELITKGKSVEKQTYKDPSKQLQRDTDHSNKTGKPRVKGPTLPLSAVLEKLQNDSEAMDTNESETHAPVDVSAKRKQKVKHEGDKSQKQTESDDPEFASWIPPQNQAGDGKTHLNAKYGY